MMMITCHWMDEGDDYGKERDIYICTIMEEQRIKRTQSRSD